MKRTLFSPIDRSRVRFETRAGSDGSQRQVIVGYAAVFDVWTELYRGSSYVIRETVRKGAFTNALAEAQDVKALFNHDRNFVLGRNLAGTLLLSEDGFGLHNEIAYPETQTIRDLVISPMERGDVSGQSFAFWPRSGGYRSTQYERDGVTFYDYELLDADLFDVSIVTNPQYPEASAALRSAGSRDEVLRALNLHEIEITRVRFETPDSIPVSDSDPSSEPEPATSAGPDLARRAARARFLQLAGI